MSLFKKKKLDEAEEIEEKAYEEERIKQAEAIGKARAKAEAEERKEAPIEKGGKFVKAASKFVKFMQSDKVQNFADGMSGSFDKSMGGSKSKTPKKKKKGKKGNWLLANMEIVSFIFLACVIALITFLVVRGLE